MELFHAKTQVLIEDDLTKGVEYLLEKEQSKNIVVFADIHVSSHPSVSKMMNSIKGRGSAELCPIPSGEPTTSFVDELVQRFKGREIDMFISIGGGSVIDLTKAVAALMVNEGKIEDYQGTGKLFYTAIKKICIPTTAGTGCEITGAAVLINPATAFKRGVAGPGVGPEYALLCAELSTSLPEDMTVGCGMDAMAHAIESYVSTKATAISKMYSKEAFIKIYQTLPKVIGDPGNIELRREMLLGSCLAGFAINNASTGACHGMSYAPGVHFKVPHGIAVDIFLTDTMQISIEKGCYDYADLYRSIPGITSTGDDKRDAELLIDAIRNLLPCQKYRKTLFDYGIKKEDFSFLYKASMGNALAYVTNPVEFTEEDSYRVYKKLLGIQ